MMKVILAALLVFAVSSCAKAREPASSAPADLPVTTDLASPPASPPSPMPSPVIPQPGHHPVTRIPWTDANIADSETVQIVFWQGPEPCSVVDHYTVDYHRNAIGISLFEAHPRTDVACPEIAMLKSVAVHLTQPIDGREIVDNHA